MARDRAPREESQQNQPPTFAAAHLAALIESSQDLIWSVDLKYRLITFNKALSEAFARSFGAKIAAGMTPRNLLPPEKAAFFPPLYEKALREGPCSAEYRLKDGRYLEMMFNPIIQDDRKVGVSVIGKDVTEQKSARETLLRVTQHYREFFEFAPETIFRVTEEGKTLAINPAGAKLLGYGSPGEAIAGLNDGSRQVWTDPAERAAFIATVEQHGEACSGPRQFRRKDGTLFGGIMTARKICGPDGKTLYYQGFMEDITERKQAEEMLRESEERYRRLFENSQFGIYRSTPGGRVVLVNPSLLAMLGYKSKEELEQRNLESEGFEPGYDRRWFKEVLERDGFIRNHEATWTRRDCKTLYVLESAVAVRDSEGAVLYYDGTVEDITERKQALDALRASEARLKEAEHLAMIGNSTWDVETDTTIWSEGLYRITGRDPSTPPPRHAERAKLYTPESFALLDAAAKHALATGEPYNLELQVVRADGALRWTRARGAAVRNESGRVCKLIGTLQDITDQKLLEEKLRSSEESFRATFEQAAVGIVQTSLEGTFLRCNQRFAEIVGYTREELPGMTFQQITAPEDLAASLGISRQMADGQIGSMAWEKRYVRKDGSYTWARITVSFECDMAGRPIHRISVVEDINARKAAEEAHRKAEEQYREIFEYAPEGIFRVEPGGQFLAINAAGLKIFGYESLEEALRVTKGSTRELWADQHDREACVEALEKKGAADSYHCWMKRRDETLAWIGFSGRKICGPDGRTLYYQGFFEDLTGHKAAQDALTKVQEQYREIFESAPEGIFQIEPGGRLLAVNPAGVKIFGFESREEAYRITRGSTGEYWADQHDRAACVEALEKHGGIDRYECWMKRHDGTLVWVGFSVRRICGPDGKTLYYQGFMEDLTKHKAAEDAVSKAEQKFREIFEDAPEGIFQTTKEGKSLALNPAGAKLLGFPSSRNAVASITDSAHEVWLNPEDRDRYTQLLEEQGEIRDFLCQFRRTDGTPIWVSLTTRRICGPDGQTLYYQGFIEDLTEQKALELDLKAKVRELQVLSEMNNALLHAKTEEELLTEYCRIAVEVAGYRMAWVGFAEEGPEKRVIPVAHYGHEDGYLKIIDPTWADTELRQGPAGRCIRAGEIVVVKDFAADRTTALWRKEGVKRGYKSCIALPFRQFEGERACLTAYGVRVSSWSDAERRLMEQVASELGFGITTLRTSLAKAQFQESLSASLEQTIEVIAETVDQRDPYTAGHQRRVADLCVAMAGKLGLSSERTQGLRVAASIHDLGKIGIPAEILSKPGLLTENQYNLLKEHAQLGYEIVKNVQFPWPIAQMILQHHEKLDGSGYPRGLKADEILLEARILAVADMIEAMSSHRPYRASKGIDVALDEALLNRGMLYDPEAVEACVNLFRHEGYQFPSP